MPKANNALYIYGDYIFLADNSDESVQNAEKFMQDKAVQFLKDRGILRIIVNRDAFNPKFFEDEPNLEPAAAVAWKLDMNPLLKKPDLNEQPVPKPLTEFLSWLGTELIGSVNAVFQCPGKHTATKLYTDTVDAIKDVISKKIDMNQGRLIR